MLGLFSLGSVVNPGFASSPSEFRASIKAVAADSTCAGRGGAIPTIMPDAGATATPAGGCPAAKPAGGIRDQPAPVSALSRVVQRIGASKLPGVRTAVYSWPANCRTCEVTCCCSSLVRVRGALNLSSSSAASAARSFASAVACRASSPAAFASAIRLSASASSSFKYPSLTFAIQTAPIVATTVSARPTIKTTLERANSRSAVWGAGHIRLSPWVPVSAIAIVLIAGVVGVIMVWRNRPRR
jgi:hypothetical protein